VPDKVPGRISQIRSLQNGERLSLLTLDEIFFSVPGLPEYPKVIQTNPFSKISKGKTDSEKAHSTNMFILKR
jgi:hypothetical protein